jgi:hypothetical protein
MLLLGCTPPGRYTEQHDFFFGIAPSLPQLVPQIKAFWPEAADRIHIDAWREVTVVEGYRVSVVEKQAVNAIAEQHKLFFINLGGYQQNKFEEQHYNLLTVKQNRGDAFRTAKETLFYQNNGFRGANSHIDDKYGIDVDELYQIEDILSPGLKEVYRIGLVPSLDLKPDAFNLGYLQLERLMLGETASE